MPKTTTPPPGEPRWSRRRDQRIGWFHEQVGATKNVAKEINRSVRRAQQLNSGEAKGVPQDFARHLDALVHGDRTTPFPLIAGAMELVLQRTSERLDDADLCARMLDVCEMEARKQGRVDLAQLGRRSDPCCRESLEALREFGPRQAIALLELSALATLRLERMDL